MSRRSCPNLVYVFLRVFVHCVLCVKPLFVLVFEVETMNRPTHWIPFNEVEKHESRECTFYSYDNYGWTCTNPTSFVEYFLSMTYKSKLTGLGRSNLVLFYSVTDIVVTSLLLDTPILYIHKSWHGLWLIHETFTTVTDGQIHVELPIE